MHILFFQKCVDYLEREHKPGGGGALVFEVGYHPRKKIHVIRVVFQDQAMYTCTSFRGAKIGKKGMVILTNLGKDMTHKLRKMHAKMHFRVYFHT